jgi:hypothetical protein
MENSRAGETVRMHTSQTTLLCLFIVAGLALEPGHTRPVAAAPTGLSSSADADPYGVDLQVSQEGGGATWTYTITKAASGARDLGNFIVNFGNCGKESPTIRNIVAATVNGVSWLDHIEASEGETGCDVDSGNIVKFDDLPAADTYAIQFTLDDVYPLAETTGWLKSGAVCLRKAVMGPGCKGYIRTSAMDASASLAGKLYTDINAYMRGFGFDYTEHPNCTGGYGGHIDGVHGDADLDPVFNKYVFRFDIHIDPVIDGDRCSSSTVDRQRNEMKSITNNSTWAKVQGKLGRVADPRVEVQASDRFSADPELHAHPPAQGAGWSEQRQPRDHDHSAGEQLGVEQENPADSFGRRREHRQRHDCRQRAVIRFRG